MYHGDRGTHGAWGQVFEPKLRGWGLGMSYNSSLEKATRDQRTYPAGYYALKSDPRVGDGQAVSVKPCQWNQLDANSSAIDFLIMYNSVNILL